MSVANDNANKSNRGIFITFEGGDGTGKSTNIAFVANLLERLGHDVVLVREPGGTSIGEKIRNVILDISNDGMSPRAELLLYEAARAQLVDDVIAPALEAGKIVMSDRFTDSTIAYQGAGRGIDRTKIELLNDFATDSIVPDMTILLTCRNRDEEQKRVTDRGVTDRLESAGNDFHSRVLDEFENIAEENPQRIALIDTSRRHCDSAVEIVDALSRIIPDLNEPASQPVINEAIREHVAAHSGDDR